jgi:hypothetical protein
VEAPGVLLGQVQIPVGKPGRLDGQAEQGLQARLIAIVASEDREHRPPGLGCLGRPSSHEQEARPSAGVLLSDITAYLPNRVGSSATDYR